MAVPPPLLSEASWTDKDKNNSDHRKTQQLESLMATTAAAFTKEATHFIEKQGQPKPSQPVVSPGPPPSFRPHTEQCFQVHTRLHDFQLAARWRLFYLSLNKEKTVKSLVCHHHIWSQPTTWRRVRTSV